MANENITPDTKLEKGEDEGTRRSSGEKSLAKLGVCFYYDFDQYIKCKSKTKGMCSFDDEDDLNLRGSA